MYYTRQKPYNSGSGLSRFLLFPTLFTKSLCDPFLSVQPGVQYLYWDHHQGGAQEPTEPGNTGPWLAGNQSRDLNKEFWLVFLLHPVVS